MLNKKPEDVEVIFSKLVAVYPELTVADKDLPDLLPKKDRKKFKEIKYLLTALIYDWILTMRMDA